MTLLEIILRALSQLGETPDNDTVAEYKEEQAVVDLINEGYADLCLSAFRPVTAETVLLDDESKLRPTDLEEVLLDVCSLTQQGRELSWKAEADETLAVDAPPGSGVRIEYTYLPAALSSDADVPAIPAHYHGALADYAVYRILLTYSNNARKRQAAMLHYDRFLSRAAAMRRECRDKTGRGAWKFHHRYNW